MNRNGNLQVHALIPAGDDVQEIKMYTWLQKKWSEILKMRQPDDVRESGGAFC